MLSFQKTTAVETSLTMILTWTSLVRRIVELEQVRTDILILIHYSQHQDDLLSNALKIVEGRLRRTSEGEDSGWTPGILDWLSDVSVQI